jgi:small subunit ribosomal protein S4
MARYTGAVCRLCRREATKLFLKGAKCASDRCPLEKRNFPPGQHGKDRKAKIVGYGLQLHEKQKAKRMYFTLESQFREYYEKANRASGVTGELLIQQLERRLDNVAFRLGFAMSRRQARQVVRHGHVEVNGRKVNIPSYQVNAGDETPRSSSSSSRARSTQRKTPCPHGWKQALRTFRARCFICPSVRT